MINATELRKAILEKLATVIDPETGVDVVRMRLIEDLIVDDTGRVTYKFRPSSPLVRLRFPYQSPSKMPWLKLMGSATNRLKSSDLLYKMN